jgi:threonine/homoserine/homoserine lactone efflux protein
MWLTVLFVFAVTEFFLSHTPGPAVLTVISQGIRNGAKPSIRGALGILTGNAIDFAISAIGLGAVLVVSEILFNIIKYLGAAYLVYLGGRMIVVSFSHHSSEELAPIETSGNRLFMQGLTTQLANPKAIVFFTALLPQFVNPNRNMALQYFVLGVVSVAVEFPVLLFYGWMAERGRNLLKKKTYSQWLDRIAGTFLVGAGIKLALAKQ